MSPVLAWSLDLLSLSLDDLLIGRQGLAPELLEVGAKRADPVGVELIDATVSRRPVDHQPRILQHFQVLRHRRPADRQLASQLADGSGTIGETLEDRAPR